MTQLGFSQGCKFNLKLKKMLKWQIKRKTKLFQPMGKSQLWNSKLKIPF